MNQENRDRWIESEISRLSEGTKILDAGAGECKWKATCLANKLEYVSQDICEYDGTGNGEGAQMGKWDTTKIDLVCDIVNMPIDDNSFDAILCSEVLEHLPYPDLAIKEMYRVLKPGGKLILTAPFCSLTHFAPYHFCTGFNKYWYEQILRDKGFVDITTESNGDYFMYMEQEIARLPGVVIQQYGNTSLLVKAICKILRAILKKYHKKQNTTDELLCFGYHVTANKK